MEYGVKRTNTEWTNNDDDSDEEEELGLNWDVVLFGCS